jgi:hypothetical protein
MNYTFRHYFTLGLMNLLIPLSGIGWWIYVTQTSTGDQQAMVSKFMKPFSGYVDSAESLTWGMVIFCIVAFWMFFKSLGADGAKKALSLTMLGFTGLIGFWLLFTLM